MTITAHRNQLPLTLFSNDSSQSKVLNFRLDDDVKSEFKSKLKEKGISQQYFLEKCVDLFLEGKLNSLFGIAEDNLISPKNVKSKKPRATDEYHRADLKIPLDIYQEILVIAERLGEPIHYKTGKPNHQNTIINLILLGIEKLQEQRPDLF